MKKQLLICSLFLLGTITTKATSLNAGDIAISSINSDDTDNFSFVLLTPISGTTTIYFTDNGWDDDADGAAANPTWRGTTEGTITWSFTGALPCGTEVQISTPSSTVSASQGTSTKSGSFNLAATADHLLAYTGTGVPLDGTEITTFITAFGLGTAGWTSDASTTGTSALPPGLTDGGNAIATLNGSDNFQYDCSTLSPVAALRTALVTVGNYTSGTANENYLAPACVYSCGSVCINPDVPSSLIATPSTICSGSNSTLSWTGNLNDATQWSVYTSSCGGTPIGTSATNSFTTGALTLTTTFYIRGEDGTGCVDESIGNCGQVTVNVLVANTGILDSTICNGDSFVFNGTTYDASNLTGTETVLASNGCDSVVTVTVTVNALAITPSAINPLIVCPSEDVILTATGSGTGDIVFYDNTETEIQRTTMGGTATQVSNQGGLTNGNYTFLVAEDNGTCQSLYDTITVFVGDTVSPTIVCQPTTVYLDNSGLAIVLPSDIDGGSSDNCGSVNLATSIQTFTCNELGANNVTLFGDDGNGNVDSCATMITVLDTVIPSVSCQNITVFLDASGLAIISANDIDNGSSDNCAGVTLNSSIQTFTCSEIGTNQVMLYATDPSNNIDSCMALVIVLDTISPTISCPTDITACAGGVVNFTTPSGADNCSQTVTQSDASGFSSGMTFPAGITTIEFTSTDASGNTISCSFNVDVTAIDTSITTSTFTITSNQAAGTYDWIDCGTGNSLIPAETNASYTATANGAYAVVVTVGNCSDTSACVNVTTVGINELNSKTSSTYPNPTKGIFTIALGSLNDNTSITVYDMLGKVIITKGSITTTTQINLSGYEKGIYFVNIQSDNETIVRKVILQ